MTEWQPIETAPKDRDILVWFDHDADPYFEQNDSHRLTDYAANAEACGYLQGAVMPLRNGCRQNLKRRTNTAAGLKYPQDGSVVATMATMKTHAMRCDGRHCLTHPRFDTLYLAGYTG